MDSQQNNMERLLATLGEAHQDGAFKSDAARYPWQNEEVRVQKPASRRFAWLRIGGPVAAAAAVAVLFVRPNLFPEQTAAPNSVEPVYVHLQTGRPEASSPVVDLNADAFDCDYNGDGLINGQDIQSAVNRRLKEGAQVDVDRLMQCLLQG